MTAADRLRALSEAVPPGTVLVEMGRPVQTPEVWDAVLRLFTALPALIEAVEALLGTEDALASVGNRIAGTNWPDNRTVDEVVRVIDRRIGQNRAAVVALDTALGGEE